MPQSLANLLVHWWKKSNVAVPAGSKADPLPFPDFIGNTGMGCFPSANPTGMR
jgi:hypothetical protein